MAVWEDLIIESFWCLSRHWADVDWSFNDDTDCSLFTCPDETSVISDMCAHFMRLASPKIVKHLQAIKRVNYDQDIKSDTRINRRSRRQDEHILMSHLVVKNVLRLFWGQLFFFLRSLASKLVSLTHEQVLNRIKTVGYWEIIRKIGRKVGKLWIIFGQFWGAKKNPNDNRSNLNLVLICEIRTHELIVLNIETNFNACILSADVQFETFKEGYFTKFFFLRLVSYESVYTFLIHDI